MAFMGWCLLAGLAVAQTQPVTAPGNAGEGFVTLFNGRDLEGWRLAGGEVPSFRVKNGLLECTGAGHYPTWLRSEQTYENFILRFEFQATAYGESGLLMHAPLHGRCSRVGIRIALSDDGCRGARIGHSGAITGVPPAGVVAVKQRYQWNRVEVRADLVFAAGFEFELQEASPPVLFHQAVAGAGRLALRVGAHLLFPRGTAGSQGLVDQALIAL